MAQLVASVSGVVLGGVAEVVGSNLARGKLFSASIGSVDSLYVYICEIGTPNGQQTSLLSERIAQQNTVFLVSRYSCEYKK